jgi:hypothetical protein
MLAAHFSVMNLRHGLYFSVAALAWVAASLGCGGGDNKGSVVTHDAGRDDSGTIKMVDAVKKSPCAIRVLPPRAAMTLARPTQALTPGQRLSSTVDRAMSHRRRTTAEWLEMRRRAVGRWLL